MTITRTVVGAVAAATALTILSPSAALADAAISVDGDIVMKPKSTLEVPISATCDDVGQETSFIVLTVTQGSYPAATYVEGQGDVTTLTCDSSEQLYRVAVPVTFGKATWRPGAASLTGILSYCFTEDGSLNCTTQAFIPSGTTVTIRPR
jgi:hypothetical protein